MKIIPTKFLSDLEAQMKDVYAAQNLQHTNIHTLQAQAQAPKGSTNNKTLLRRLSMQKGQEWALREKTQYAGSPRTVKTTGEYDGELC